MKTIALILALSIGSIGFSAKCAVRTTDKFFGKIDVSKALHRIELGAFNNGVPVKIVELMRQIGGVTPIKSRKGSAYYTEAFSSQEEAARSLPKFQALGFNKAKHVVEYKKTMYDLREFNYLASGDKVQEDNSDAPVIRIWK